MKRKITIVIAIIVLLVGAAIILYPTVSDYVNSLVQRRVITEYENVVKQLDVEQYDDILESAEKYNEEFSSRTAFVLSLGEAELEKYNSMLVIPGTTAMGHIEIPAIGISLPIYHGTSDAVLQNGIGHMEGSSLPVGGESSHSVLSGHTGLPSSKLFTNIDKLEVGDVFYLHILNNIYAYEVDQKLTVLPHDLSPLKIEEGCDYCTLVTCTPYGINTHRLLVRGHRIEYTASENTQTESSGRIENVTEISIHDLVTVALCVASVILILIIILIAFHRRRKKKLKKQSASEGMDGREGGNAETDECDKACESSNCNEYKEYKNKSKKQKQKQK